jgi:hypothetical protein
VGETNISTCAGLSVFFSLDLCLSYRLRCGTWNTETNPNTHELWSVFFLNLFAARKGFDVGTNLNRI